MISYDLPLYYEVHSISISSLSKNRLRKFHKTFKNPPPPPSLFRINPLKIFLKSFPEWYWLCVLWITLTCAKVGHQFICIGPAEFFDPPMPAMGLSCPEHGCDCTHWYHCCHYINASIWSNLQFWLTYCIVPTTESSTYNIDAKLRFTNICQLILGTVSREKTAVLLDFV